MTETIATFDFHDLFVLDLANNHQGSAAHGAAIIERCADVKLLRAIVRPPENSETRVAVEQMQGRLSEVRDRKSVV